MTEPLSPGALAEQEKVANRKCAACGENPPSDGGWLCTKCRYSL